MDKVNDNITNQALYSKLFDKYGDDFRSLNWGSKQSQERRFDILCTIADLNQSTILDVGCGLSHFYEWLNSKNISVEYHGLDITEEMVNKSREKFPDSTFSVGTVLDFTNATMRQYDYVFASGIFYLRTNNPKDYMEKTISKLFSLATKGVAFNCLSSWTEDIDKGEFYANPIDVILYCKTLTSKIVFQHHYHPGDFTIIIYK
jgi:ubiquinone/menaquinone biosynthesis C-methylase UbiE